MLLFVSTESSQGCQPYIIPACEHHSTGDRPPCSEGGGTPKCIKTCDADYTVPYAEDLHFGACVFPWLHVTNLRLLFWTNPV